MFFWLGFGILSLLTMVWAILIRSDVCAYMESQVKVLGEENRSSVDTKALKLYFVYYTVMLMVILLVYAFSFLVLL